MRRDTGRGLYHPLAPYLYLLPAACILIPFVFFALLRVFVYSFQEYNIFTPPRWIGMENYTRLFQDPKFRTALVNSVRYFLGVVPLLVFLPLLIAAAVNHPLKGMRLFRALFYFPVITSMVVAGIAWKWIYTERGVLNFLLTDILGVLKEPVSWLNNRRTALPGVMGVTIWKGLGYYMVIYLAGLQSIPRELYEAAAMDGAGGFLRLRRITMPMLIPSISVVTILSAMASMKVFDEIYVMTGGGPFGSTRTLVFEIYINAFDRIRIGYAGAEAVVLFLILLIFSYFSLKTSEKRY